MTRRSRCGSSGPAIRQIGPSPCCVRAAKIRQIAARDRVRTCQQMVEHDADAVDVASGRRGRAGQHLRRQIQGRAGDFDSGVPSNSRPVPKSISTSRPSSATITFCALMSRCSRPAACTADTARHNSTPIVRDLLRRKCLSAAKRLFERAALDELHPQADAAVDSFSAVDGDDVRMANACEQPAFFDDGGLRATLPADTRQQLQRHLAIQAGIPGAIDLAERALADALEHAQMAPVVLPPRLPAISPLRATSRNAASVLSCSISGRSVASASESTLVQSTAVPSRMAPATSSRSGGALTVSFPRQGAAARAAPPCGPRPASVSRGSPPARRTNSPSPRAR